MKFLIALLLASVSTLAVSDEMVRGYVRKDGTYVQPHLRSSPNNYKFDNYSSQGNSNPYTGQRGYTSNEYSTPPVYFTPPQQYSQPQYVKPYGNN